jgi:Bacterial membrane protein YfhO
MPALTEDDGALPPRWRRVIPDALGLTWIIVVGLLLLLPALSHGVFLGSYDLLAKLGLSKQPGVIAHNGQLGDQIDAIIPWTNLAWTQVHAGHLPLWNPYNGLGLPLAFNWQSAPFSLPSAIGYLFPLRYAYDIGIATTLLVAGSGAYVLGRVLGLGVLASAMAGTVFELSGPMTGWLGFPHSAVMSWAGWWFAAAWMIVSGRHRSYSIALLAVTVALAIYAGQPEVIIVIAIALVIFVSIVLACRLPLFNGSGPILRPLRDVVMGLAVGAGLAAPLLLPGLQLASLSVRKGTIGARGLSFHDLTYLASQGFDGLPIVGSRIFGDSIFYYETVAYVGVIAIVLAAVAALRLIRRPDVMAFVGVLLVSGAVVFVPPVNLLASHLPVIGTVQWIRALMPLALAFAVLSAFGMQLFVKAYANRSDCMWFVGGFGLMGAIIALVYAVGRGDLPAASAHIRMTSFIWPTIGVLIGLSAALAMGHLQRMHSSGRRARYARAGTLICAVLLAVESGFLVFAGAPILSSSSRTVTATAAERKLQQTVGNARVGVGGGCLKTGIVPSVNSILGVRELNAYDPVLPGKYFTSWFAITRTSAGFKAFNLYCPRVTSVSVARLYGLGYLLESGNRAGPAGSIFVRAIGDETLYRIPNASFATLTPSGKTPTSVFASGTPVAVTAPDPTTWTMRTSSTTAGVLRLRLSDVPGWKAQIDGKPLSLQQFAGVMLQARIPAGNHLIVVHYWPSTFTAGLVIALVSSAGLVTFLIVDRRRRPRTTSRS